MSLITPKTALISLSDKSNLDELIKFLLVQEVKIISTGGTYNAIKKITDKVIEVSEFTGFEEMMDGRVKTLHPKIHAGILARRETDLEVLTERGYEVIDMVIVNLYPFQETVASGCEFDEAIEKIDIGGPTMIRSAAKNFKDVAVISDPNDYGRLINEWGEKGGISYKKLLKKLMLVNLLKLSSLLVLKKLHWRSWLKRKMYAFYASIWNKIIHIQVLLKKCLEEY